MREGRQGYVIGLAVNIIVLLDIPGICTATKLFTNVSIGTPGRRHDVTALRNSRFWKRLEEEGVHSLFYDDDHHLVGDAGYMLRSWCVRPFE